MSSSSPTSRRSFLADSARAAFGAMIVPRHVLGGPGYAAPSDRLALGVIGASGRGRNNVSELLKGGHQVVALADADLGFVERSVDDEPLRAAYADARKYADFREMLAREANGLDAVVISTPDHVHAIAAKRAMEAGKHVYVEKPLTYTVEEARVLLETARKTGVVTQMGNQGHSTDDARRVNEWIQAGVLGPVREVHVWTNRPIWPQGVPRPSKALGRPADTRWRDLSDVYAGALGGTYTVPPGLDWDLWLGPSEWVDYHPVYAPFNWRGWIGWGVGALGDMGAHLIDHPFWALDLGLPASVEATSTPFGEDAEGNPASFPLATQVTYEFPARGALPPVTMTWYDGGLMPGRPQVVPSDVVLPRAGGVLHVGERGVLLHLGHGKEPRFFPESLAAEAAEVPRTYRRVETSHQLNFAEAAMGKVPPSSPFEYAAPLTEVMLLGLVALRTGQGVQILYDGERMEVTNQPEANGLLRRSYRKGFGLEK